MASVEISAGENKLISILAFSENISTRFLTEISLDPDKYSLSYADTSMALYDGIANNTHDIYIVDATDMIDDEKKSMLAMKILKSKFKHMVRLLLIVKDVPPEVTGMEAFGPLRLIEFHFPKIKMSSLLNELAAIDESEWKIAKTKDTGCRIKGDDKFVDITRLV